MSHLCDTYTRSVRRATGDTDVCHLYFFEGDDDYDDCDDDDDDYDNVG